MIRLKRTRLKAAPRIIWHLNCSLMMVSIASNLTFGRLAVFFLRWRLVNHHFQRPDWKTWSKKFKKHLFQRLILAACSFKTYSADALRRTPLRESAGSTFVSIPSGRRRSTLGRCRDNHSLTLTSKYQEELTPTSSQSSKQEMAFLSLTLLITSSHQRSIPCASAKRYKKTWWMQAVLMLSLKVKTRSWYSRKKSMRNLALLKWKKSRHTPLRIPLTTPKWRLWRMMTFQFSKSKTLSKKKSLQLNQEKTSTKQRKKRSLSWDSTLTTKTTSQKCL